jgi:hypothetical protein
MVVCPEPCDFGCYHCVPHVRTSACANVCHRIGDSCVPVKMESDPTGRSAHEAGAKLDSGKPLAGVLGDFSLALLEVAKVGTHGAEKYSRGGWQSVPEGVTRYSDAMWRHLLAERHEEMDGSGLRHAAHLAWNALARLELMLRGESADTTA